MPVLTLAILLACNSAPKERVSVVERPAVVIVAPLSGANKNNGQQAVEGILLAVDDQYRVEAIDEGRGDPIAAAKAIKPLVGVVAHISPIAAARFAQRWEESGLPVVLSTTQVGSKLPAILPDSVALAHCSSAFLPKSGLFIANDGSPGGIQAAEQLKRAVPPKYFVESRSVDPRQIGREAQRVKGTWAKTIVYIGDPATGGNLLRTLRSVDSKVEFFGIGLYDVAFLDAAGPEATQNAVVTSGDRPCLDASVRDGFQQRFGAPPIAAALDAYDSARLLRTAYETAEVEGDQNRLEGTKRRLNTVEASGIAGSIKMGKDGSPDPDWCTAFIVKENQFHYRGVARVDDAHTKLEIVHESGKVLPTFENAATPPLPVPASTP